MLPEEDQRILDILAITDRIIEKGLKELDQKNSLQFFNDATHAVAHLMIARARYADASRI